MSDERDQVLDAVKRGTTDLELALMDLSAYMSADELTAAERRIMESATGKMASATMQLKRMLDKARGKGR